MSQGHFFALPDDLAFHRELSAKEYKYARPGIEPMPWGTREMSVKDPFGNRLTFSTAADRE